MKAALACVPCFIRQALEALDASGADQATKERVLRRLLSELAVADWAVVPVRVSQRIHRVIREETGNHDPYLQLKNRMNSLALQLAPELMERVREHSDPREALVRAAIAGNLLDAGAKTRIEPEQLADHLEEIWEVPLFGSAAALFEAAAEAESILYLADNAGEIIFDRLLIEALPMENIIVAVRGSPVINDATIDDAKAAGLDALVPVVDNGSDAPGTLLDECSAPFRALFERADLIISKGQGNYETLSDCDKNIFFLLTVKCEIIAEDSGAPLSSLLVKRSSQGARKRFRRAFDF